MDQSDNFFDIPNWQQPTRINYEDRVLNPSQYPVLKNPDGSYSTHRMAWSGVRDGSVAYPTIIQDKNGALKQLGDDEAFNHAMKTGEYKKFIDPKEAAAYAEGGYKSMWGKGDGTTLLDQLRTIGTRIAK